jgi:hypothetical protein
MSENKKVGLSLLFQREIEKRAQISKGEMNDRIEKDTFSFGESLWS